MTTFSKSKEGTPRHPSRTHAEPGTGLKRLPGVARSFRSSAHQTRLVESRRVGAALKQLHEERPGPAARSLPRRGPIQRWQRSCAHRPRGASRNGRHQGKVGKLVVVENSDKVHNVVVCSLLVIPTTFSVTHHGGTSTRAASQDVSRILGRPWKRCLT